MDTVAHPHRAGRTGATIGTGAPGLRFASDARRATTKSFQADEKQMRRMLLAGTVLFLVPAALGRLTGWRWRPWPPGPGGYRSVVSEARSAAGTYIPFAFLG